MTKKIKIVLFLCTSVILIFLLSLSLIRSLSAIIELGPFNDQHIYRRKTSTFIRHFGKFRNHSPFYSTFYNFVRTSEISSTAYSLTQKIYLFFSFPPLTSSAKIFPPTGTDLDFSTLLHLQQVLQLRFLQVLRASNFFRPPEYRVRCSLPTKRAPHVQCGNTVSKISR